MAVCKDVMASTRSQDEGCLSYTFFGRRDNPRELMLFEQWRDADSVKAHLARLYLRLYRVFGPPDEKEPYPPTHHRRQISKAFLDLFDKTEAVRYDASGDTAQLHDRGARLEDVVAGSELVFPVRRLAPAGRGVEAGDRARLRRLRRHVPADGLSQRPIRTPPEENARQIFRVLCYGN